MVLVLNSSGLQLWADEQEGVILEDLEGGRREIFGAEKSVSSRVWWGNTNLCDSCLRSPRLNGAVATFFCLPQTHSVAGDVLVFTSVHRVAAPLGRGSRCIGDMGGRDECRDW